MSVGLFTTEIYANWVRKEKLERVVECIERAIALYPFYYNWEMLAEVRYLPVILSPFSYLHRIC